jgi:asparagine synthase (glutamine-hydrolysing)
MKNNLLCFINPFFAYNKIRLFFKEDIMCGFVGFVNLKHDLQDRREILTRMTKKLTKRGPDEENFYLAPKVNLGHRRLIIIDPKNGGQPMSAKYDDITYTIVYNGQLYNASELRDKLKEIGYEFKGYCDTEVILKAYIEWRK